MTENTEWIYSIKPQMLEFLDHMRHPRVRGFYSYSLSGDIFDPLTTKWGLGNTVFAAKTYYMLDSVDRSNHKEMSAFIKSFQTKSGEICDPLIEKKSSLRRIVSSFRGLDFDNISNRQTRIAETRQAFAALRCLGSRPDKSFDLVALTKEDISGYIHSLNWRSPWNAASHLSHLIFFLRNNDKESEDTEDLLAFAFQETDRYRQKDGSWAGKGVSLPDYQKVNGAMKMLVAYNAAGKDDFSNPEGLIDLCLNALNDDNACNNFNIICVLYNCLKKTGYKKDKIIDFCASRLGIYKKYWLPDYGGFSFLPGKANMIYYGAKISRGLAEPDIHGTHLYLWGITLISEVLGINSELGFRPPIT